MIRVTKDTDYMNKEEMVFRNMIAWENTLNNQPDFWLLKQFHGMRLIPINDRSDNTKDTLHKITLILLKRGLIKVEDLQ